MESNILKVKPKIVSKGLLTHSNTIVVPPSLRSVPKKSKKKFTTETELPNLK